MKIVFYNETILSGGIEKCIESFIQEFSNKHDIEIVYVDDKKLDMRIVEILSKNAKVHKLEKNEIIKADVCIWCRLYMDYHNLKKQIIANKNILWVHSKPRERENCILDNEEFIKDLDEIVCVSKTVQNMLNVNKKSTVIHNFIPENVKELSGEEIPEKNILKEETTLKLVTVSRLSNGKGFDRVVNLVKMLKDNKINFEYIIIGKGRAKEQEIRESLSKYKEVVFVGYKENPFPYIKKADYLVQLSDFETWGNVITEAKILGIPVIITSFESAFEQVEDDKIGIIIDLKENNYNKYLDRIINNKGIYKNNLKDFKYENEIEKWKSVL